MVLEGGLHADVPLRRDVVGHREDALPLLRHLPEPARAAVVLENPLHEILTPKALALRDLFEVLEEVRELLAFHDTLIPD